MIILAAAWMPVWFMGPSNRSEPARDSESSGERAAPAPPPGVIRLWGIDPRAQQTVKVQLTRTTSGFKGMITHNRLISVKRQYPKIGEVNESWELLPEEHSFSLPPFTEREAGQKGQPASRIVEVFVMVPQRPCDGLPSFDTELETRLHATGSIDAESRRGEHHDDRSNSTVVTVVGLHLKLIITADRPDVYAAEVSNGSGLPPRRLEFSTDKVAHGYLRSTSITVANRFATGALHNLVLETASSSH